VVFEPTIEFLQGRNRFRGGLVVPHALFGRTLGAHSRVDEIDVAGVLFTRNAVPHLRRVLQIGFGLPDQLRHLVQPVDDVPVAILRRCVMKHVGRVQTVPQ